MKTIDHRIMNLAVQWLELKRADWRDHVKLAHLDMSNPRYCILGQVFGRYLMPATDFTNWVQSETQDDIFGEVEHPFAPSPEGKTEITGFWVRIVLEDNA